jgi:hypothetical protein
MAKLKSSLIFSKREKHFLLFILLLGGLTVGVVADPFAAFGPSSEWGADVEIMAVGYGDNRYDDYADFPAGANVLLSGSRAVTIDYDGIVDLDALSESDIPFRIDVSGPVPDDLPTNTPGMYPMVTHAVGNFFYANELGNKVLAPIRIFENTSVDLGNVHYYFGFSVMFTTRGETKFGPSQGLAWYTPDTDDNDWVGRQYAPVRPIDLTTVVGIRVQSLTDTFEFEGFINEVKVVNERARYTLSESISGVSSDLEIFNTLYDWEEDNIKGAIVAEAHRIAYDIIDSEDEKLASITLGATLQLGCDSAVGWTLYWQNIDEALNEIGYDYVGTINVYNVEYIYDVLVDISINGVPITDWMGSWAQGTEDGTLPADSQPYEEPWMLYIFIAVAAVLVLTIARKFML